MMIRAVAFALVVVAFVPPASAQVRYRRPYSGSYRLGYGFDNNGGGGGCDDYACGNACYDGHTGSDFATPFGTEVRAAASGRVTVAHNGCANYGYVGNPCGGRCGNYIQIEHSDGSRTIYCHMQNGSLRVGVGARVTCGQVIGLSASSGSSSGPHLHFGYRASAGSSSDDPFRGACGGPVSLWVGQRGYLEAPSTSCGCTSSGAETCNGRDDDCDGRVDEGVTRACSSACGSGRQTCSSGSWGACSAPQPRTETCNGDDDDCDSRTDEGDLCEIDLLNDQPSAYAAPRFTDVNADGLADLCARGYGGVRCWTASPSGWGAGWDPIPWGDESGWDDVTNYATLRMGDLDGDGTADVCARANAGVYCALSSGSGFEAASRWRDGLSDANGWDHPRRYTTLRLADVDGDGMDDLCARDAEGFGCWISDGTRFDRRVEGPRWSDELGWGVAKHYGTIRMGDLNGDRRADVCARAIVGVQCWLSSGDGFPTRVDGPAWSDDAGWGAMGSWSTIRLVDFDGDGLGDLCGRSSEALICARGNGAGFEPSVEVAALADSSGWGDISNYATLRAGDVDGDGGADLCARANAEVYCWSWDGSGFVRITGPAWSDEGSWNNPRYYETIRLADFDGDGLEDVCGRAGAGWRCHPSTRAGFGDAVTFDELTNDGGWVEHRYWSTIMSAGRACRVEMEACNGRDDDCDGMVDEHSAGEICNATDDDCDGMVDEHAGAEACNAADDDCDGSVDEGLSCVPIDGGVAGPDGAVILPDGRVVGPDTTLRSGCACRVSAAGDAPFGLGLLAVLCLAARRRRRLRPARRGRDRACPAG